ncbi:hypothetical protein [Inhella sp.]|uniref:hypothetical protein n=1 Tax=Inhella sp. TaxID=1921806 RepID=UPI0035AE04A4
MNNLHPFPAGSRRLWLVYAALSLLAMLPSVPLWLQSPLVLTRFEFDYFLGAYEGERWSIGDPVDFGRAMHFALMLAIGLVYARIALRLWEAAPGSVSVRRVAAYGALLTLVYSLGMPWVSPDVFFYIGTGWLESHYGLNPYLVSMSKVPGALTEPMFANVFPGFLAGTTGYGPVFQKLAAGVAAISLGSDKLALVIYKIVNGLLHGVASWLVYRLAPARMAVPALFLYALNPVILFAIQTCAHNDHFMNVAVLATLMMLKQGRAMWAGVALGVAFSTKYFALIYLPIACLALLIRPMDSRQQRLRAVLLLILGFAAMAALAHLLYPGSADQFMRVASQGIGVFRNSLFHVMVALNFSLVIFELNWLDNYFSYARVANELKLAYVLGYSVLLAVYVRRLREEWLMALAELCLLSTLLYFVLVNATNQEWYLTWLMGFACITAGKAELALLLRFSTLFLPFVIFTVKGHVPAILFSNVLLYALVCYASLAYYLGQRRHFGVPWRS